MLERNKECRYCSRPIGERQSVYCCNECSKRARLGYRSVRERESSPCPGCGLGFERRTHKQVFCTDECRTMHIRSLRPDKKCDVCGGPFSASSKAKTCSSSCYEKRSEALWLQDKNSRFGPPRTCKQCAKVFTYGGDAFKEFCSRSCASECAKETKRRSSQIRRARKAKATIEHFGPTYILKRDDYICQACGVKTRPDKKPTHPQYPNVDHIVPLSMGGEHSKKNCRCVCASCNSKKCNRTLNDQLLLFG